MTTDSPAYPSGEYRGLSMRDVFALAALQSMSGQFMAECGEMCQDRSDVLHALTQLSSSCYLIADCMLEARAR